MLDLVKAGVLDLCRCCLIVWVGASEVHRELFLSEPNHQERIIGEGPKLPGSVSRYNCGSFLLRQAFGAD